MLHMTTCAIYLRISQDDARTGLAVERQREDCRRIARERGWTVYREYTDNAISASKRDVRRPAYDQMVADYALGKFAAIVTYDLDRLTRQPSQLEDWIAAAEETGLMLTTANGEADLSTDNGRLFARIKASVARAEIERKGARQKRANEQRIEKGLPTPGRRRYGYETDGVTVREAEAAIVRRLFDHVASGGSLRSAVGWLTAEGIDPAPGRTWTARRIKDTLLNPVYTGQVRRRGEAIASDAVAPIVSAKLAAEVAAILTDPSRTTSPGPKPKHLLSGLMSCGVCGSTMYYMRGYMCRVDTSHVFIKAEIAERYVLDAVASALLAGGELFQTTPEALTITDLTKRHQLNGDRVREILADRDEGLIPANVARSRLVELKAERESIEAELARIRSERSASNSLAAIAAELLDAPEVDVTGWNARKAALLEHFDGLDLDRRREILRALVDVTVDSGRDVTQRVHIEHKLATTLNPDAVDPAWIDD